MTPSLDLLDANPPAGSPAYGAPAAIPGLYRESGMRPWLMQRVSGVLLVVFVAIHWWTVHYAVLPQVLTVENISIRLKTLLFIIVDMGLIGTTIYHGLNGLRNIIVDMRIWPEATASITRTLHAIGIATFAYALFALGPFLVR
ncbi:MAG: hypothetical protein HY558_05655 [Euryarchaeota archaeon]|nr:hypothetical protein [Euryarchaeota archaeon]